MLNVNLEMENLDETSKWGCHLLTYWVGTKKEVEERKSRGGPGCPFHTETLDFLNQWTS